MITLGNTTGTATSTGLEPWSIHKVKLLSCEHEIGEKEENNEKKKYYALDFVYGNETGDFRVRLFCPVGDADGCKRKMDSSNNFETASKEEDFIYGVVHNLSVGDEDPEKGSPIKRFETIYPRIDPTKNEESFKSFCEKVELLAKKTIIAPEVELSLKLIGGKTGYARVQSILGIKKDGNCYIRNNYILREDSKIKHAYTAKELATKAKYEQNIASGAAGASSVGGNDDLEGSTIGAKPIDGINTDDI